MSYSACDFMDDVCGACLDAGLVTREQFEEAEEDSGAVATLVLDAIALLVKREAA